MALKRGGLVLALVAADLAGLVYLNGLHNPFVYDDRLTIVGNPSLRDPSVLPLLLHSVFRPVLNLSYAVDHTLWGFRPLGYHLTSVLLHMVNTLLLFLLASLAVRDWQQRNPDAERRSPTAVAFVAAALFAVHPMMTEAVAYVSGRSEVLCASFVLLGIVAMRRALVDGSARFIALGLGAMALALGTKEIAAALPLLLLTYDRVLLDPSPASRRRRLRRVHLPIIGVFALIGAARLMTYFYVEPRTGAAILPYVGAQTVVLWRYLWLMLVPLQQSVVHSAHEVRSIGDLRMLVAAAALIGVATIAFVGRRRAPLSTLGVVWFFVVLAPSSVIPLGEPMAEHRVYLASAGFFLVLGDFAGSLLAKSALAGHGRALAIGAFVWVLVVFGALTVARNTVWADPVTLWQDAARKAPDVWRAHFSLANALGESGNCRDAIPEFEAAARLSPQAQIFLNLATCLVAEGRADEGARAYQLALTFEPEYVPAHYQLALLALRSGDRDGAQRHFLQAVTRNPRDVPWRAFLIGRHQLAFADPIRTLEFCQEIRRTAGYSPDVDQCLRRNQHP